MTNEAKELLKSKPELCKEIYEACFGQSLPFCEWIKEHTKKDWEILSFKSTRSSRVGVFTLIDGVYIGHNSCGNIRRPNYHELLDNVKKGFYTIHSVRRLSDNEVFTDSEETMQGKINRFGIVDGAMMVECESKFAECDLNINDLIKRTPLFTTNDDINIYEGDTFWFVNPYMEIISCPTDGYSKNFRLDPNNKGHFSTRQAAEQWVEDNKPVISKAQLLEAGFSTHAIKAILDKHI